MIRPMDQINGGIHVVNVTAIGLYPLEVKGTVQVHTAVSPGVSLHVGDKNMTVQQGVMGIIRIHGKDLLFFVCTLMEKHKIRRNRIGSLYDRRFSDLVPRILWLC